MQSMQYDELKQMMKECEDCLVINVLPREYFNKEHIPGSVNIPHEDPNFTKKVEEAAGSKDRKIVVYCASFSCDASPKAAKKLDDAGFSNVYDYEGGMKDWQENQQKKAA